MVVSKSRSDVKGRSALPPVEETNMYRELRVSSVPFYAPIVQLDRWRPSKPTDGGSNPSRRTTVSTERNMNLKRQEWEELDKWKSHGSDLSDEVLEEIRVSDLGVLYNVKVYAVDGKLLRNHVDIDFTTGANPGRYMFVPDGEIWVEKIMIPSDFAPCVVHEFVEYLLMRDSGLSYDDAHRKANKYEGEMRDGVVDGNIKVEAYLEVVGVVKNFLKGKLGGQK